MFWLGVLLSTQLVPIITNWFFGFTGLFYISAVINLFSVFLVLLGVPETKVVFIIKFISPASLTHLVYLCGILITLGCMS